VAVIAALPDDVERRLCAEQERAGSSPTGGVHQGSNGARLATIRRGCALNSQGIGWSCVHAARSRRATMMSLPTAASGFVNSTRPWELATTTMLGTSPTDGPS
jgi:hypothetical protein